MTDREEIVELLPVLRAYGLALTCSRKDANALVRETLRGAIAEVRTLPGSANLKIWLLRTMRGRFYASAQTRAVTTTGPGAPRPDRRPPPRGDLPAAVAKLAVHDRELLVLVVMLGESRDTAAGICGLNTAIVQSRVDRARRLIAGSPAPAAAGTPGPLA